MCEKEPVELAKETLGGTIWTTEKKESKHIFYWWATATRQTEKALKQVLPYLRAKKPQAELALEFYKVLDRQQEHRRWGYKHSGSYAPELINTILDERQFYVDAIREAKRNSKTLKTGEQPWLM